MDKKFIPVRIDIYDLRYQVEKHLGFLPVCSQLIMQAVVDNALNNRLPLFLFLRQLCGQTYSEYSQFIEETVTHLCDQLQAQVHRIIPVTFWDKVEIILITDGCLECNVYVEFNGLTSPLLPGAGLAKSVDEFAIRLVSRQYSY